MKTTVQTINLSDFQITELEYAVNLLKQGDVVAFPTETVYGLGANAYNSDAIEKIFKAKGRPQDNPLIVHVSSVEMLTNLIGELDEKARLIASQFWPGPLTMIFRKPETIPEIITAGLDTVAIRMPSHPIANKLIELCGFPIAAPSANVSGKPSPTSAEHVLDDLNGRIPLIINGGSSEVGLESTVISLYTDPPMILRPGGITYEQLKEVVPNIEIYGKTIKSIEMEEKPPTPGLKYRHYSPNAQLYLFEGNIHQKSENINQIARELLENNHTIGIVRTHSTYSIDAEVKSNPRCEVITLIDEEESFFIAQKLFETLRHFDKRETEFILFESVAEIDVGLAIMNRLRKAASKIIL